MKTKSFFRYLLYFIVIIGLIIIKDVINNMNTAYLRSNFQINYFLLIPSTLTGILIGVCLGLEYFFNEKKKRGRWKIIFPKVIFIVLPALYLSLTYLLMYGNDISRIIGYPLMLLYMRSSSFVSYFQLIFGYAVMTSFYKSNELDF